MSSAVKIIGAGVDTLVLNIYSTDSEGEVVKRRVDDDLQEELRLLKEKAQVEIENAYDLMERLPLLWSYAVGRVGGGADGLPDGWLRYVVPTEDTNRSRWPVYPDWQVIQTAFQPVGTQEEDEEQEALLQEVDAELVVHPMVTSFTRKKAARPADGSVVPESPLPTAALPKPLHLRPIVRKRHYEVNMRQMVAQVAGVPRDNEGVASLRGWKVAR